MQCTRESVCLLVSHAVCVGRMVAMVMAVCLSLCVCARDTRMASKTSRSAARTLLRTHLHSPQLFSWTNDKVLFCCVCICFESTCCRPTCLPIWIPTCTFSPLCHSSLSFAFSSIPDPTSLHNMKVGRGELLKEDLGHMRQFQGKVISGGDRTGF